MMVNGAIRGLVHEAESLFLQALEISTIDDDPKQIIASSEELIKLYLGKKDFERLSYYRGLVIENNKIINSNNSKIRFKAMMASTELEEERE